MGRTKWTEDYFRNRLRTERGNRGWSQADIAKMLSDKGIRMHWTTVAKIEAGERSVRIDEATAIADLFETSLDALLGRNVERGTDLAYTLRAVLNTARQSSQQAAAIADALGLSLDDLDALEFDGRERLDAEMRAAQNVLAEAQTILLNASKFGLPPRSRVTLRKDLAMPETRTYVVAPEGSNDDA